MSVARVTVEASCGEKERVGGCTRLRDSEIIIFLVQDYFLREFVHDSWTAQLKNRNHAGVSEGLT